MCSTAEGPVRALVFVMNRDNPGYIKNLPQEEVVAIVRRAAGRYGPCTEYVVQTEQALRAAGIHDRRLAQIADAIRAEQHALPEG
jgi:cation transport protein ChaC